MVLSRGRLTIHIRTRGEALVAEVHGPLSDLSVPVLRSAVDGLLLAQAPTVVLDLRATEEVGRAALLELARLDRHAARLGVRLLVEVGPGTVRGTLRSHGLPVGDRTAPPPLAPR